MLIIKVEFESMTLRSVHDSSFNKIIRWSDSFYIHKIKRYNLM